MADDMTRHVLIVGLDVKNERLYQRYRDSMTPILHDHGGAFGYDFAIGKVLKSETDARINRVFTMTFPEKSDAERFFSDPAYRAVRAELFEPAVESITTIAAFDEDAHAMRAFNRAASGTR
jgi:uncharacterized protein (DUF1330 family)